MRTAPDKLCWQRNGVHKCLAIFQQRLVHVCKALPCEVAFHQPTHGGAADILVQFVVHPGVDVAKEHDLLLERVQRQVAGWLGKTAGNAQMQDYGASAYVREKMKANKEQNIQQVTTFLLVHKFQTRQLVALLVRLTMRVMLDFSETFPSSPQILRQCLHGPSLNKASTPHNLQRSITLGSIAEYWV